jgi:hypothetical protein
MRRALPLALSGALLACKPDLGERESLVTRTQVLAIRGEPPEAKPGEPVIYDLLVATPAGPMTAPIASWAHCTSPKLLTENGAVSAACLRDAVQPLAEGPPPIAAAIPDQACAVFGPEVTSADLRPRDPDVTGGFYQPIRATVFGPETVIAFGLERIGCRLANAPALVATDFAARYVANKNPELQPLEAPPRVVRGATVTLRARWSPGSAEPYVAYDLASQTVVQRREWLRVSWFATGGTFEQDRTGRDEHELEAFTENAWTAPATAGTAHLFVVLRDARGGVAFATVPIVVEH